MIQFVQQVADGLTIPAPPAAAAPAIHPFVGRGVWTVATSASMRER